MELHLDVGGLTTVSVRGGDAALAGEYARALRPWQNTDTPVPDGVLVKLVDEPPSWTERLGPTWDGQRTLHGPGHAGVQLDRGWWAVQVGAPGAIRVGPGASPSRVVGDAVKPAVMGVIARRGGATLHASAVAHDGVATAIAGWSEAGKTETALAFAEDGASLLTDKWTGLRPDGRIVPIPGSVHVRAWALAYLPRLRAGRSATMRAQLVVARASRLGPWLSRRLPGQAAAEVTRRLDDLTDLGSRLRFGPADIDAATGAPTPDGPVPLRRLALLRTTTDGDDIRVGSAGGAAVIDALMASAAFERRPWTTLLERTRYADALADGTGPGATAVDELERVNLATILADVELLEVRAPFPTDPRRVRDAILAVW